MHNPILMLNFSHTLEKLLPIKQPLLQLPLLRKPHNKKPTYLWFRSDGGIKDPGYSIGFNSCTICIINPFFDKTNYLCSIHLPQFFIH